MIKKILSWSFFGCIFLGIYSDRPLPFWAWMWLWHHSYLSNFDNVYISNDHKTDFTTRRVRNSQLIAFIRTGQRCIPDPSHIKNRTFSKNSKVAAILILTAFKDINYSLKTVHLRCLTGYRIYFCWWIHHSP